MCEVDASAQEAMIDGLADGVIVYDGANTSSTEASIGHMCGCWMAEKAELRASSCLMSKPGDSDLNTQ
jgi:hypothetical protein